MPFLKVGLHAKASRSRYRPYQLLTPYLTPTTPKMSSDLLERTIYVVLFLLEMFSAQTTLVIFYITGCLCQDADAIFPVYNSTIVSSQEKGRSLWPECVAPADSEEFHTTDG